MSKTLAIMAVILLGVGLMTAPAMAGSTSNPCAVNPCAVKKMNPCTANPCAAKKMNPCAANPCAAKKLNPCAANPCAAKPGASNGNTSIRPHAFDNFGQAAALGEKMWNDENLGTAGLACMSCHADYESLNLDRNKNYPHFVEMVGDVVTLDQMINFCMVNPMQGKQFEKNSKELTAMAAYFRAYRMKYRNEHGK
jgi:cytochrome c